jgi:parallel beta-helix repeat protein
MKNFKLLGVVVGMLLGLVPLFATAGELPNFELPKIQAGIVEDTSKHFSITDSEYLNVTLDSTETIKLKMESIPEMVTLMIEPSFVSSSTQVTLTGFKPNTTYYLYQDNYHNLTELTTDESGTFSYLQDISTFHIVFIQPRHSTRFIADDATGGDCAKAIDPIGVWNATTKTCTLTVDLMETIQIDSHNITLDGNGHTLTGYNTGKGIYFEHKSGVVVKNLIIKNFSVGINFVYASNTTLENNTTSNNQYGMYATGGSNNKIRANFLSNNNIDFCSAWFDGNFLTNNTFTNNGAGIFLGGSSRNILKDNSISNNAGQGISLYQGSNDNIITNNIITSSIELIQSNRNSLMGNTLSYYSGVSLRSSNNNKIYRNNFIGYAMISLSADSVGNIFNLPLPIGGNYWGYCKDINRDNICDVPLVFTGGQDNFPWTKQNGWNEPVSTNTPPTLTPLSDPDFSDGINPNKGVANKDLLTFKTIYTDTENVTPTKMDVVIRNTVDFNTDFYGEQFTLSDHAIVVPGSSINERFPQTKKFVGNDNWGNSITGGESITATLKRQNIYQATTTVIVDSSLASTGEVSADILLEALNSASVVIGSNRMHIPINLDIEKTKTVSIVATSTSPISALRFTAESTNDTGVWIEKFELGETIPMVVDTAVATSSLSNGTFDDGEQYTVSSKFPKGKYTFHFETADGVSSTSTATKNFTTGHSNIIFFPGIMGSRLFERSADCGSTHDVLPTERERWVAMQDCDHEYLALDLAGRGKSVFQLYTKEGTAGAVDDTYSLNIYQSFMNDLDWWKNHDHIITDYSIIPYDWRLSLEDILQNGALSSDGKLSYGTDQGFYSAYIFKQLKAMQESSDSGKVTIIAHSNGGLVTKALIQKLKDDNNPLANNIDDIIFVAVPQAGTPDAIGGLLYGTKLGPWGVVMSAEQSRDLLRYMPVGYNLLPSSSFGVSVFTPFIEFEGNAVSSEITTRYGSSIDTYDELTDYLLGGDGRPEASYEDTNSPARLNKRLLAQATSTHQILDNWTPATSTTVYEIAGWGLYTTEGYRYSKNKICEPGTFSSRQGKITIPCLGYHYEIKIEDRKTINGDKTVIEKSAHLMQISTTTKKYWVNLEEYNSQDFTVNREHKDIFEVDTLRPFIRSIVVNNITVQPFITDNNYSLTPSGREFVKYVIHSPLNLNVYDTLGNHTGISPEGLVENGIKGSQYSELGESKTIIIPAEVAHTLNLDAYASGSFTLDIETLVGDTVTASTTFEAVPTATTTKANIVWDPQTEISSSTALNIDFNADNVVDVSLPSTPDGTTLYDVTPPEVAISFSTTTNDILIAGTDEGGIASVVTTNSKTTITDKAGNIFVIPFTKYKDGKTKLKVVFEKLIYNDIVKNIPKTTLEYEWELNKNGTIKELEQDVVIKNTRRVSAEYESKKNETKITDKEKEEGEKSNIKTKKPGVVLFTISTQNGVVGVQY